MAAINNRRSPKQGTKGRRGQRRRDSSPTLDPPLFIFYLILPTFFLSSLFPLDRSFLCATSLSLSLLLLYVHNMKGWFNQTKEVGGEKSSQECSRQKEKCVLRVKSRWHALETKRKPWFLTWRWFAVNKGVVCAVAWTFWWASLCFHCRVILDVLLHLCDSVSSSVNKKRWW